MLLVSHLLVNVKKSFVKGFWQTNAWGRVSLVLLGIPLSELLSELQFWEVSLG